MNRRKTLFAIASLYGLSLTDFAFGASPGDECSEFTMDPASQALKDDLDALGMRRYSEEGVAVFLACEDLVAAKAGRPSAPPNELSEKIAKGLRENGRAWQHLYPIAPEGDVATIIEVLAVRDFNNDRLESK